MARKKLTRAEEKMSPEELTAYRKQKDDASKSGYSSYIEVRGFDQFRVRFRGKQFGGTKSLKPYRTLAEAESACADFLNKFKRAGVGLDGIEKEFAEAERADKTIFAHLIRERQQEILNDPEKGKNHPHYAMLKAILRNDDLCSTPLSTIASLHFEQYIADRLDEGVVSATVRREIGMMSGIITKAMNRGFGQTFKDGNPVSQKKIDYPEDSEHRTRRVSAEEEAEIRKALNAMAKSGYLKIVFEIAITLGMRQGEIRQIEWQDINFEKGYIYIPKTKTNRPRSVPLLDNIAELLKDWKKRNEELAHRYEIDLPSLVFWNKASGKIQGLSKDAVRQMWRKVCDKHAKIDLPKIKIKAKVKNKETGRMQTVIKEKANPDNLHFHDLRHEATSRLFENHGLSIIEVMSITGHRTTTMMERYTHLQAQEIGKKINEVGGKLSEMPITKEMGEFLEIEAKRLKVPAEGVVSLLIMQAMHEKQVLAA